MPFSGRPRAAVGPRPQASERCAGHARARRRARYTDDAAAERAAVCKNGDGRARALRRDAAQAARGLYKRVAITKVQESAAVAGNHGFEDFSLARAAPGASCWKVAASGHAVVVAAVAWFLILLAFLLTLLPAA